MNFLESDLFSFAYVPGWYSQLDALAGLARPEPWRFREPMYLTKNQDTPILERYIHAIFKKQAIDYSEEKSLEKAAWYFHVENEYACFHTGLYTARYKAIYGCFDRNKRQASMLDWYFRGFADEISPWLKYVSPLPARPSYDMTQYGVNYNPEWPIRVNGKSATEKVKGTRDQYRRVKQDDYLVADGRHDAIIDEDTWNKAREKRRETGVKWNKIHDLDHEHLLAGILKCPICGASLAGTVRRKKYPSGKVNSTFYYRCLHRKRIDGTDKKCDFKPSLNQIDTDAEIIGVIHDMVNDEKFEAFIRSKLDEKVDVSSFEAERDGLRTQLIQATGAKDKLNQQLDRLDVTDRHYDRKYQDMQDRLDALYDRIADLEEKIDDVTDKISGAYDENLTSKQLCKVLLQFDEMFEEMTDLERKEFLYTLIERIDLFPERQENGSILKRIRFKFRVDYDAEAGGKVLLNENDVEDIYICNKSGNRADDSAYTSGRHYPYYILVKNGNTHVSPTFDFDVYFYVLDANGEWEVVQSVRKEGMERRQTMDEAGIVFPDVAAEYPGVTQIGWVDSDGNEITGDSQCISEFGQMMLYAKYDKKLINIQYRSVSEEGWMNSGSRKLLLSSDITFGELKTEIENTAAPEGSYQGIAFERWRLDSTDGFQEAAPLPDKPQLSFSASAVYDKNILTVFYKGPVSNKEWRSLSKVIVYEKGRTYGELIDSAIENAPEVSIDGYQFEKWEYKLNGSRYGWLEETETDDSDNYMQIQCVSKFLGHAMILIRQCYSRDGNRDFRYPIYMTKSGTKWNEVSKGIRNLEVPPEIQADQTFDGWIIAPEPEEDESGVKNGLEISMVAVYKPPFENDTTVTDRPDDPIVTPPIVDIPVIKLPETKPSDEPLTGEQPDQKEELPSGGQPDQKDELPSGEQTGKEDGLLPEDQQGQKSVLSEEEITQIVDIINNTETGKTVPVNMEEATVIPKEILEAAKGKDIGIILDMGGYSWEVNGMDIAAAHLKSIDLKVIMNTNNIPGKTIQAIAGENSIVRQLSLAHEGDFGFKAKLTVNVGNEYVGKYGNLYYHDSEGKLVFIDTGKVSSSGKVSLTFSHASDYMIVMSEQQMSQADVPPELEPDAKPNGNQNPAGSDQDQTGSGNQNQTGDDQKQPGSGNQNPNGGGQEKPGTGSAGLSGSGNKKRTENEEKQSENNIQNENTAFQNQAETNNRNQAASNSQKEVQNRSVQTGDKTEGMLMILTSILSVGILAFMLKKKGGTD